MLVAIISIVNVKIRLFWNTTIRLDVNVLSVVGVVTRREKSRSNFAQNLRIANGNNIGNPLMTEPYLNKIYFSSKRNLLGIYHH